MRPNKRGQAALEYMLLLGVLLAFLVPVVVYSTETTARSVGALEGKRAVQSIAGAADRVYAMGGGRMYVLVTVPPGITGQSVANKTIRLTLSSGDAASDIVGSTIGNISGSMPVSYGTHRVFVEMLPNGVINISS